MEVDLLLADSVVVAEGKLYLQGAGWNVIFTGVIPARHPRLGLGVLIRVPYHATNHGHKFELRLEDEDGSTVPLGDGPPGTKTPDGKIHRLQGDFNMGRPPHLHPGDEQIIPLALNVDGLVFEKAGRYRFVFEVDGTEMESIGFRLEHTPQMRLAG